MTTATASVEECTGEKLLAMPGGEAYELIDGELVERPVGHESDWIASLISHAFNSHVLPLDLGCVTGSQTGLQIFPGRPDHIPRPDVVFIARDRLPGGRPFAGWVQVPPDIVVEVVSPNDLAANLDTKVAEYLQAGVRLVWVVVPETRRIHVYRPDGRDATFGPADTITGEDVLPGFSALVADLIPE
jgi:Uma2 family endonuclease